MDEREPVEEGTNWLRCELFRKPPDVRCRQTYFTYLLLT